MGRGRFTRSALRIGTIAGALVLIACIIWLDIRTTLWQEMVILAGLAAGLVSFLLTSVVIDRIVRVETERRWAPVTHLALTELLHQLADDECSDLSRGRVVPRTFVFSETDDRGVMLIELERLRHEILAERTELASTLGIWVQFLTSSGDHEEIMVDIAELALQLDGVRDRVFELEQALTDDVDSTNARHHLLQAIQVCNSHISGLSSTIDGRRGHAASGLASRSKSARAEAYD